ncbi:MAG: VPLPA-CTERM sorting domain-containing protein [Gammaproteobacteria bacterium]|nr:VPLPA-CTERM sorting domain-containing protein [Gammaproteobacteria bacterium]
MKFFKSGLVITAITFSTATNAALVERLGGLAYYDTVADLTWLADANYARTSGYDANGHMTWAEANDWAAQLTVDGVGGWRLADTVDVDNDGGTYTNLYEGVDWGYNITAHSELSNMFYNVLGNTAYYDTSGNIQSGYGLSNTGPFSNLQSAKYWSATEYVSSTNYAWSFDMNYGSQLGGSMDYSTFAWAVQSGDVGDISAVPVPAAVWLFGSGLLGLVSLARREKA